MSNRKTKLIIIGALCLVVVCLTVGYAILSANLNISGQASVNGGRWDVVFLKNDAKVVAEGRAKCNLGTVENSSIKDLTVSLEEAGDSCTFTIPIQNTGTVEAYLTDVVGKDNSLTFNSTSVSDIEKIKPLVTYEVKYGDMQINSQTDFSKIPVLKADAKETVTLKAMINADDSIGKTNPITIGGFDRTFVFNSNSLEEGSTDSVVPLGSPNKPVLNGDMIPVYYEKTSDTTGNWVKADTANSDNNWYDYDSQKWANAVTVKNTVKDLSGNNNDGVVHGAVVGNGSADFDGKDDYIDVGLAGRDFKNQITMVLKFKYKKLPQTAEEDIFGNWDNAGGGFTYNYNGSNKLQLLLLSDESSAYQIVGTEISENTMYTVVGTYDGSNMKLYLNGKLVDQKSVVMNIRVSSEEFLIGGNPEPQGMVGRYGNVDVSDALIFDKALSETEIQQHYSNEITLGETKPLVYYDFQEIPARQKYQGSSSGTVISTEDINTMWVWIPRYSYTIKSEDGTNYYGKASSDNGSPTQELPGEIDVKFIPSTITETGSAQYTGSSPRNWRTNAAFDFDNKKRAGIWVSKFEPAGTLSSACTNEICDISNVTVKPNLSSLRNQTVSSFFYMARSMQKNRNPYGFSSTSGDLHMMKNDEWGAVVYLSQSKYGKYGNSNYTGVNKEVYINNSSDYITGNSGGEPGASSNSGITHAYNDMNNFSGVGASTTGTIYGIYDMSGGAWEYVISVLEFDSQIESTYPGKIVTGYSGFKGLSSSGSETGTVNLPDAKYYNTYKSANPTSYLWSDVNAEAACNGDLCYGQALSETSQWYGDYAIFVRRGYPWFTRSSSGSDGSMAGVFYASSGNGSSSISISCRLVLTP